MKSIARLHCYRNYSVPLSQSAQHTGLVLIRLGSTFSVCEYGQRRGATLPKSRNHYGLDKDEIDIVGENDGIGDVLGAPDDLEDILPHQSVIPQ